LISFVSTKPSGNFPLLSKKKLQQTIQSAGNPGRDIVILDANDYEKVNNTFVPAIMVPLKG
jgi:hypothetical protein